MHKRLDLTQLGGLYAYQNTLAFMQDGYGNVLDALAVGLGTRIVLSGCVDSGLSVADGWVIIDGTIMPFVGGVKPGTPMIKVNDVTTKELYDDGNLKDFYFTKYASLVSVGDFNYSLLQRLPGSKGIMQSLLDVQAMVKALAVEAAVIMEGCAVSSVDTGASTLAIAAGKAMIDGVWLEVPAYAGTYPVYLSPDATWGTAIPGGSYVRFNPHTSQRYADVQRRAQTPLGEIKMYKTLSDRFDPVTGVGKWEMTGFKLLTTMQNRVPVGLWWDGVAVSNVSDAAHATAGNQFGEKTHELTEAELPTVNVSIDIYSNDSNGGSQTNTAYLNNDSGAVPDTLDFSFGGGDAHNNMQPSTVVVYVERV